MGVTRRDFTKILAMGGAVAAAGVGGTILVFGTGDGGASSPRAFAVNHDDSVYVKMSSGASMTVTVHDSATGAVLESFDAVTADGIFSLRSDRVSFTEIAPPVAA